MNCHASPVPRPALEVADIVRAAGSEYRQAHPISGQQDRVLRAIARCRTAALGGQRAQCNHCGAITISYRSCRNRHCPKCQTLAKQRWLERQCASLLDIDYWHLVFTLPHGLNPLAQGNPRVIYRLLFHAASQTLLEFGRNPRWIGGDVGITMVLHTWGQRLDQHIHVHAVVTGGALSRDGERWMPTRRGFLFPVRALSRVFRAKYLEALRQAHLDGELRFAGSTSALCDTAAFQNFITELKAKDWVAYAKPPFGGAAQVMAYLGRYTHRVAIANHRLVSFKDDTVRFRWRDYAHGNTKKIMALDAGEFLRRFLLHTLPHRFAWQPLPAQQTDPLPRPAQSTGARACLSRICRGHDVAPDRHRLTTLPHLSAGAVAGDCFHRSRVNPPSHTQGSGASSMNRLKNITSMNDPDLCRSVWPDPYLCPSVDCRFGRVASLARTTIVRYQCRYYRLGDDWLRLAKADCTPIAQLLSP